MDDDCRWGKVDVVGDLVDVPHGAVPEGELDLPLGQETVPILVNGVESSLSLENEIWLSQIWSFDHSLTNFHKWHFWN